MVWVPGKQLQGGRYTIQKVLGDGRFGITYLARDKNGDALVIKTPNDEALNRPDFDKVTASFCAGGGQASQVQTSPYCEG